MITQERTILSTPDQVNRSRFMVTQPPYNNSYPNGMDPYNNAPMPVNTTAPTVVNNFYKYKTEVPAAPPAYPTAPAVEVVNSTTPYPAVVANPVAAVDIEYEKHHGHGHHGRHHRPHVAQTRVYGTRPAGYEPGYLRFTLIALLRGMAVIFLVIATACIASSCGVKCRPYSYTFYDFSMSNWESMAYGRDSPQNNVEGQWYAFVVALLFAIVSLILCFLSCRVSYITRSGEAALLFFGAIMIGAAAVVETYYVAGWKRQTGCYCASWAVACGFLWASALIYLLDGCFVRRQDTIITFYEY